jgi:hypothetical protein
MVKKPAFENREEAVRAAEKTIKKIKAQAWFNLIAPEAEDGGPPPEPVMDDEEAEAIMAEYGDGTSGGGGERVYADETESQNFF